MVEEETNGASIRGSPSEATRMLKEIMETMRRQNDEHAKEFRRGQEEATLWMNEALRGQERLQRRNEEFQRHVEDRMLGR